MISRFARVGFFGRGSSGWVSSVGAAPGPFHETGLPAASTQPFPTAQHSISAATRNAMHLEIMVTV